MRFPRLLFLRMAIWIPILCKLCNIKVKLEYKAPCMHFFSNSIKGLKNIYVKV